MNDKTRTLNSLLNSLAGVLAQGINVLLGLAVRTVFIHKLSVEYLGVNGLFSNILTILSLAELGVESAIVYNMYQPIAENDHVQISRLMNFYRKAYSIIGCFIAIAGICVVPFLDYIIKDQPDISNLKGIYILFLSNTVLSYFFAYKRSIFNADQRQRVIKIANIITIIGRSVIQIIVLMLFSNYVLYLLTQIAFTVVQNLCISLYADKCYPFLKQHRTEKLSVSDRKNVFNNIKALMIYRIGSVALDGTDNIIISAVDGLVSVGLLSNYTLITNSLQLFLDAITTSLTGSVGNFIVKEDENRREELLEEITFIDYLLYGVVFVGGMSVINSFISLWAGESFVLSTEVVFVLLLNVYIYGMISSIWTFRSTMGLFVHGRWRPLISAIINIAVSIWWGREIGLIGILLGTTFTRLVTNFWYDPYIVYKYGLEKKPFKYYFKWLIYLGVTLLDISFILIIHTIINISGLLSIIVYGILGVIIFSISVVVFFSRTHEFKYVLHLCLNVIDRFFKHRK